MGKGAVLEVEISPQLLRPLAYRILSKKYGLNIKSDGLLELSKFIGRTFGIEWKHSAETLKTLESFATIWREQGRGIFVNGQGVDEVTKEIVKRNKAAQERLGMDLGQTSKLDGGVKDSCNDQDNSVDEQLDSSQLPLAEMSQSTLPVRDKENNLISINTDGIGDRGMEARLVWTDYFKVINCFKQQRFMYNANKKRYMVVSEKEREGSRCKLEDKLKIWDLESAIALYQTRYSIVKDRVLRNPNFQNGSGFNPLSSIVQLQNQLEMESPGFKSNIYMPITQIKNLLGRDGRNFLILGLLVKDAKGNWTLEDSSGTVELDISEAIPTKDSYYVAGCIVLIEGIYSSIGNKFHVSSLTHPPGERREETLDAIGNLDLLGVHGVSTENYIARLDNDLKVRLHLLERELTDNRFVILGGNIYLDQITTFEALEKAFDKLEENPPTLIVFNGSFSSVPLHPSASSKNLTAIKAYRNNFDTLANLLKNYEGLINESTFIFIPGYNDPWSSMASLGVAETLPMRQIPEILVGKMNRTCKNIIWGSNPTRIAYLSQEIVLMRDELSARMKRNNIIFPTLEEEKREEYMLLQQELQDENNNPDLSISQLIKSRDQLPACVQQARKLVKTILDQQHLSPFTMRLRPIEWEFDFFLHLSPIPSILVLCDTTISKYDVTYNGCKSLNPGSFIHKRIARYTEFIPCVRKAVEEEIPF